MWPGRNPALMREPDENVDRVAKQVVDAALEVHRHLGPGFEGHYKDALEMELVWRGLRVVREYRVPVAYKGQPLGRSYHIDMVVDDVLLVEAKATLDTHPVFRAQLLSYLKMTGHQVGLLINFHVPLLKFGITRVANTRLATWRLGANAAGPAAADP